MHWAQRKRPILSHTPPRLEFSQHQRLSWPNITQILGFFAPQGRLPTRESTKGTAADRYYFWSFLFALGGMEKCLSVDEPFRDKRAKFPVKLDEGQDLITPNKKFKFFLEDFVIKTFFQLRNYSQSPFFYGQGMKSMWKIPHFLV